MFARLIVVVVCYAFKVPLLSASKKKKTEKKTTKQTKTFTAIPCRINNNYDQKALPSQTNRR